VEIFFRDIGPPVPAVTLDSHTCTVNRQSPVCAYKNLTIPINCGLFAAGRSAVEEGSGQDIDRME
jgi:hypothetical protein